MSLENIESATNPQPANPPITEAQYRAVKRLRAIRRGYQRQLKRKPNSAEKAALDRLCLMQLRWEVAIHDPKCTSNDIVRLDNCARRARLDFERICGIVVGPTPKRQATLSSIMGTRP